MDNGAFWLLIVLIILAFVVFRARRGKKSDDNGEKS